MKNRRTIKAAALVFAAMLAAFALFSAGCSPSQTWASSVIQQNYYRFDGDYSSIEKLDGLSIESMMERLDIYSAYYTREEYEKVLADNAGSKVGIGVSYSFEEGTGVRIRSVVGNSPAYYAGLKAGDVIKSGAAEYETRVFVKSEDFSSFVSGREEGESFTFTLADGSTVTCAREEYHASYACMYTATQTYSVEYSKSGNMDIAAGGGGLPQLPADAAYMYLSQFYGGAAVEIKELFKLFNGGGYTTLILDLRGNGGGYVDLMADIGGLFTAHISQKHAAMKAVYRDGNEQITYCTQYSGSDLDGTLPQGTKVCVMADENTASASEALIGVLYSYGVIDYGDIFLTERNGVAKSYGKGIMQSTFRNILTGEALKLTVAGIFWPKDNITIHGVGLTPADGCRTAVSTDGIVNVGYDEELQTVINSLNV